MEKTKIYDFRFILGHEGELPEVQGESLRSTLALLKEKDGEEVSLKDVIKAFEEDSCLEDWLYCDIDYVYSDKTFTVDICWASAEPEADVETTKKNHLIITLHLGMVPSFENCDAFKEYLDDIIEDWVHPAASFLYKYAK